MSKKLLAAGMMTLLAAPAFAAADVNKEIAIAVEHAGYAADGTTIGKAHFHLHHALNCIVGPNGNGFDSKEMNPCEKAGVGIIPDSTNAANKPALEAAAAKARDGLASNDLTAAKADAQAVSAKLKGLK